MTAKPKSGGSVRLLPAAMATAAALLGIKAVAMAESVAETAQPAAGQSSPAGAAASAASATPATPTAQCDIPSLAEMAGLSQAEVQVLQALSARRQELDRRSSEVETQDELMAAAERRLDERLAELRRLETTVNDLLGNLDETQQQRINSLVDVYQRMRAKDAAAVFDGLDDEVLIEVASRMRQANLAEVMGRMEPERARRLTQMLAERARPPVAANSLLARTAQASQATTAAPPSSTSN